MAERDPKKADELSVFSTQLELCAAAVIELECSSEEAVTRVLSKNKGRSALELALNVEARNFLAQPCVRGFIKTTWRGEFTIKNSRLYREDASFGRKLVCQTVLLLQVCASPAFSRLLSPSLAFSRHLSPSLIISHLLSPYPAFSHLLPPS